MRRTVHLSVVMLLLFACAEDAPECGNIGGNWSVRSERVGGTCDPTLGNQTLGVVIRMDSGKWEATLPGLEGGCRGDFDQATCRFTTTCDFFDKESRRVATSIIEWSFNGGNFHGSTLSRIYNPAVVRDCSADYRDTGSKL